jgi:hypothetical protein
MAWAAPAGHWHPDDLAPLSKRFVSSAERLQASMEAPQSSADRMAAALREYQEALDLLGASAPAADRERLAALERQYRAEYAALQRFADQVITDYDEAFTASVERAVAGFGEVHQCPSRIAGPGGGPRIPGAPPASQPNPECLGEDLNAALAARVDEDAALTAAVDEIVARAWPAVTVAAEPRPPVGGGERWLSVRDLMVAGARARLRAIDDQDDELRAPVEAKLEDGATAAQVAAMAPEVERIEQQTAAARAALAAPVIAAADVAFAKWKGEPATGWCANPAALGGCTGTNASRELVGRLVDDKKVAKSFPTE